MRYGIKLVGVSGVVLHGSGAVLRGGEWVSFYDPEAHNGQGELHSTSDPAKALSFENKWAALAQYQRVPACRPKRADGKPNKPMTAFTVSVEPLPGQEEK